MKNLWVSWEGQEKGPYGMEAIVELIRREVVTSTTPVRFDGTQRWKAAADVPEVAVHLPQALVPRTVAMSTAALETPSPRPHSPPLPPPLALSPDAPGSPPHAPPSPSPPASASGVGRLVRRLVVGVALGGGAVGLLIGAAVALPPLLSPDPLIADEVLEEGLPADVTSLAVVRARAPAGGCTASGIWASALSQLCGGIDVARRLLDAEGQPAGALDANGTLGVLRAEGLREGLQCGHRLADAMSGFHIVVVASGDDEASQVVGLMQLGELSDPPFPLSHNFSGLSGRCHPREAGSTECDDDRRALVRRGAWWAFGETAGAVAGYAREWNRGAERSESTNMEYARLLGEQLSADAMVTHVDIRPEALPFGTICASVPGGVAACLPDEVADTNARIRANLRGVAVQARVPDEDSFDPEVRWTMTFATRDDADAEEVARDLDELVRDWRAHLENRESAFVEQIRESGADDIDQREAMLRVFVRAIRGAAVESDGRLARLVARGELSEAEQREVRAHLETRVRSREAAASIVEAVIAGRDPERADLSRLVGEDGAAWMLEPRATEATCARIREHVAELSDGGVATADFGHLFRVRRRWVEGSCVGVVMPQSLFTCLTGAVDVRAMADCVEPTPPWLPQPVRETYEGVLTDDDGRIAQDGSPYDDYPLELEADLTLTVEMHSASFDTFLGLLGPDGAQLATDDDGAGGTNSRIQYRTTAPGRYTVRANTYRASGRGAYTVRVVALPGAI